MTGEGRLYYLDEPGQMVTHFLDGLMLIFHRPSGVTHMVDSPVPEILSVLDQEPRSAVDIMRSLAEQFDLETDADAFSDLARHLDELCDLGLVREALCGTA